MSRLATLALAIAPRRRAVSRIRTERIARVIRELEEFVSPPKQTRKRAASERFRSTGAHE